VFCRLLQDLYNNVIKLFAKLPLAALVEGNTLILHGGLFRAPPVDAEGEPLYATLDDVPEDVLKGLRTGSLEDLKKAQKGGEDPDPESKQRRHHHSRCQVTGFCMLSRLPAPCIPVMQLVCW
jgi:hypothetical protein